MNTHAVEHEGVAIQLSAKARQHLAWLAGGLVGGFAIPFLFADTLDLPRDLYYGIYIAFVAAFFVLW